MPWLEKDELRVGLGCMRLDENGAETIAAAVDAGITVFDTARAYDGNEGPCRRLAHPADGEGLDLNAQRCMLRHAR